MDSGFVFSLITGLTVFILLFFQLYGSYYLLQSKLFSPKEKSFRMALIWMLPLLGTFYVLYNLAPDELEFEPADAGFEIDEDKTAIVEVESSTARDRETTV